MPSQCRPVVTPKTGTNWKWRLIVTHSFCWSQVILCQYADTEEILPINVKRNLNLFVSCVVLQVQDTSFILCIVYVQPEIPVKQLKNLNTAPSSKLLYHRLDLLGQPSSCLHFKQLATVGKKSSKPKVLDHYIV